MKKILLVFLGLFFITLNFTSTASATEGIVVKSKFGVKKISKIGAENVSYSLINPDRIEYVGSKRVEYNLSGDIIKIGSERVLTSLSGLMIKVGDKDVIYSGKMIHSIGKDTVFYK